MNRENIYKAVSALIVEFIFHEDPYNGITREEAQREVIQGLKKDPIQAADDFLQAMREYESEETHLRTAELLSAIIKSI